MLFGLLLIFQVLQFDIVNHGNQYPEETIPQATCFSQSFVASTSNWATNFEKAPIDSDPTYPFRPPLQGPALRQESHGGFGIIPMALRLWQVVQQKPQQLPGLQTPLVKGHAPRQYSEVTSHSPSCTWSTGTTSRMGLERQIPGQTTWQWTRERQGQGSERKCSQKGKREDERSQCTGSNLPFFQLYHNDTSMAHAGRDQGNKPDSLCSFPDSDFCFQFRTCKCSTQALWRFDDSQYMGK